MMEAFSKLTLPPLESLRWDFAYWDSKEQKLTRSLEVSLIHQHLPRSLVAIIRSLHLNRHRANFRYQLVLKPLSLRVEDHSLSNLNQFLHSVPRLINSFWSGWFLWAFFTKLLENNRPQNHLNYMLELISFAQFLTLRYLFLIPQHWHFQPSLWVLPTKNLDHYFDPSFHPLVLHLLMRIFGRFLFWIV